MSQAYTFLFDNPATITHDEELIRFDSGVASLRDLALDGTFFANYTTDIDATWSDGTGTGTANGGAAVSGGKLDLKGGAGKSVDYAGDKNADFQQRGTIRLDYIPNYTGSPAATRTLFTISEADSSTNNLIRLNHTAAGNLVLRVTNAVGAVIINSVVIGAYAPTTGVKDEVELDVDLTTGATRLFIDGNQLGSTILTTGTRGSTIGLLRVGQDEAKANNSDAEIDNFVVFDVVKHTANYIVGDDTEEVPDTKPGYATSDPKMVLPGSFNASDLLTFGSSTTRPTGTEVKFILVLDSVRKWFNGVQWTESDGTYSQSNTGSDINTNIESLELSSTVTVSIECFLHSDDGTATPDASSSTITFEIEAGEPDRPNKCLVYGWIHDLTGSPLSGIQIRASAGGFWHGDHAILPTANTVLTDDNGYWELLLTETGTIKIHPYTFTIREDPTGGAQAAEYIFQNVQVPNSASENFSNMAPFDSIFNPYGDPTEAQRYAATYSPIVIEQGSNFELTITVKDSGGSPVNLTSVTEVEMHFRPSKLAQSSILEISLTGGEISIPTPANGEILISVDDSVTSTIRQGGDYDLELTDFPAAGKKKRLMEGTFAVTPEVTR
jgi:hypothetical protein